MKTNVMMLALVLCSWSAFAQHDHAAAKPETEQGMAKFKDAKLGTAYAHYVHLKDALVASKADAAKTGAAELQKALKGLAGSDAAAEAAGKIAASADLKEQRTLFSTLSNEMATLLKGGKLSAGMLYLDYCPMANNNEGAYWLSNEKEIKNPYFGSSMLKCGSVKEMIH